MLARLFLIGVVLVSSDRTDGRMLQSGGPSSGPSGGPSSGPSATPTPPTPAPLATPAPPATPAPATPAPATTVAATTVASTTVAPATTTTVAPATTTTVAPATTTTMDPNMTMNTTTPVPISTPQVEMSLTMEVEDPRAFVNEPGSVSVMKTAVAEVANVDVNTVDVVLFVKNLRRLLQAERRLQATAVGVNATITVEDEGAANSLQTLIAAVSPEEMSNATNVALADAGLTQFSVNVTALAAVIVLPPVSPSPPPSPLGETNCASVRWKAYYSLAPFVAVSAWFISQA